MSDRSAGGSGASRDLGVATEPTHAKPPAMPALRSPALVLAAVARVGTASGLCISDDDCSLNGVCLAGSCHCVPEWRGHDCGTLNLLPARSDPEAAGFYEAHASSWGGSLVQEGSVYHMFASRMVNGCGLSEWTSNSAVVHLTASDAEGPYVLNSTVVPHFAHGPSVRRMQDGGFLMMHLGCGGGGSARNCSSPPHPGPSPVPTPAPSTDCKFEKGFDYKNGIMAKVKVTSVAECCGLCRTFAKHCAVAVLNGGTCFMKSTLANKVNCSRCESCIPTPVVPLANRKADRKPKCSGPFNVSIKTARSIYGPWTNSTAVWLSSATQQPSWFQRHGKTFTNPSPFLLPNGSVLCAYRANSQRPGQSDSGEHVSLAMAQTILGPYVDSRSHPLISTWSEDPFLWRDERGYWHMLMHAPLHSKPQPNQGKLIGAHAFSRDALNWTVSATPPYTSLVNFSNGTSFDMRRRERPQLLLSESGQPRYFSSGVEDFADHTWTLVMKVNS